MSDFLQANGQPRLRDNDPRLTLDDYTMPDFCFLTGPNPDWDDACLQWNKNDYTQFDTAVTWDISDRVSMVATTGLSDFSSDGISDWQLLGMESRRDQTESKTVWQEVVFNIELFDGKVDLITGGNYFAEELISPRAPLYNAIGSSVFYRDCAGRRYGLRQPMGLRRQRDHATALQCRRVASATHGRQLRQDRHRVARRVHQCQLAHDGSIEPHARLTRHLRGA